MGKPELESLSEWAVGIIVIILLILFAWATIFGKDGSSSWNCQSTGYSENCDQNTVKEENKYFEQRGNEYFESQLP